MKETFQKEKACEICVLRNNCKHKEYVEYCISYYYMKKAIEKSEESGDRLR